MCGVLKYVSIPLGLFKGMHLGGDSLSRHTQPFENDHQKSNSRISKPWVTQGLQSGCSGMGPWLMVSFCRHYLELRGVFDATGGNFFPLTV